MQLKLNMGTYGWRHKHWTGTFYPEDLPMADDDRTGSLAEDWRLAYYSNEFNSVLVPASYWQTVMASECEQWLESVHDGFQFYVECQSSLLDAHSLANLTAALIKLKPQLSALVILDTYQSGGEVPVRDQLTKLAALLEVEIIDAALDGSRFNLFEDELTDLRVTRAAVEQFVAQVDKNITTEAAIIVSHPQLQPANLSKFRAVLDLMGY